MEFRLFLDRRAARRVLAGLLLFEASAVLVYLVSFFLGHPESAFHRAIHYQFNLDGEANLLAWFSSAQLFAAGALILALSFASNVREIPSRLMFRLAGCALVFLSADEAGMIHETVGDALKGVAAVPRLFKYDTQGVWWPVYAALAVAGAVLGLRMAVQFWKRYRRESVVVGLGLALAAAGMLGWEAIGYGISERRFPTLTAFEYAIEELSEMFGVSLALYGLLLLSSRWTGKASAAQNAPAPVPLAGVGFDAKAQHGDGASVLRLGDHAPATGNEV